MKGFIMHPLDVFHFCPKCGADQFYISSPASKKCAVCGFEFYKNPVPAAAIVAFDDQDRLLCIRRAKNPGKGTLGVPGGFMDKGETIQETAIRETKEETGIDVEVVSLLDNIPNSYVYAGMEQNPIDFYFLGKIKDITQMHPQEGETAEVLFIPRDQINPNDFGMLSTQTLLKKLLNK